ncbi:MAG: DUF481 domain-containing protein [Pseudomonadota bacterium]
MLNAVKKITAIVILFAGSAFQAAVADVIHLKNGDVISGTIVKKETTTIVFRTSYAGDLNIQWSEVESLQSEKPVHIVLSDGSNMRGPVKEYEPGVATIVLQENKKGEEEQLQEGEKEFDLRQTRYINPTPDLTGEGIRWTGNINAGGTLTKGNNDNKYMYFDGETIARTLKNRFTLGGAFRRTEDRDNTTQFNSRGYGKYDHFFTPKWYSYVNTTHEMDRFREIRLRSVIGVGTGYQIFETPNRNLALEGGFNYIREDFYVDTDDEYPGARWAVKYDQTLFSGKVKFFHENETLVGFQEENHFLFYSKTGLRFPLVFNMNASAQLNYNRDSSPSQNRKKEDAILMFTVGYGW